MLVSRRRVIGAGAAAAASICLPLPGVGAWLSGPATAKPGPASPKSRAGASVPDLFSSSANFRPYLNTPFRLAVGPQQSADVTLTQVVDTPAPAGAPTARTSGRGPAPGPCFSLLFSTPTAHPPAQATYTVRHPALGTFQMFLTPTGTNHQYEAVVNRRLT